MKGGLEIKKAQLKVRSIKVPVAGSHVTIKMSLKMGQSVP